MLQAAANGRLEVVRVLVEDGRSDVAARDNYPLRWAAQNGHADVWADERRLVVVLILT